MLLVNQKPLPTTANVDRNHEMYGYIKEYEDGMKKLRTEFPLGTIKLNRVGYPKKNKGVAKPIPTFICPLEWMAEGATGSALWSYCKGTPKIMPNGLNDIPEKHISINGADLVLDWKKDADFAFFIFFKTPLVKKDGVRGTMDMFAIKDPEREAMKRADAKRATLELTKAVYDGLVDENKLRIVAASWGVANAYKDLPDLVREKLETTVLAAEAKKSKEPNNISLRGIKEFLEDVKADSEIRRKALIQYAVDEKKIEFDKFSMKFKNKERDVLSVPAQYLNDRITYAAFFFGQKNSEWQTFIREVIDLDLLNRQDKRGLYWIYGELGLDPEKKKVEEIRDELVAMLVV